MRDLEFYMPRAVAQKLFTLTDDPKAGLVTCYMTHAFQLHWVETT